MDDEARWWKIERFSSSTLDIPEYMLTLKSEICLSFEILGASQPRWPEAKARHQYKLYIP